MNRRALFLDKDGTLIPDVPFNVDPTRITLYPDAGKALAWLQRSGFRLVLISNQSGVARGFFAETALVHVEMRLRELLAPWDVHLDGFYYCPHLPTGTVAPYAVDCECRKPAPGLLRKAAREHGLSLADSWMVGDILNDVEAGNRAGCRTVLLDNGNETEWLPGKYRTPTAIVGSLTEAAEVVLGSLRRVNVHHPMPNV